MEITFETAWSAFWLSLLFALLGFMCSGVITKFVLSFLSPQARNNLHFRWEPRFEKFMMALVFCLNWWLYRPPIDFTIWKISVVNLIVFGILLARQIRKGQW